MKWRKIKYILFHRSVLAGLALVAQVAVLFVMVNEFTAHFDYFYWFCIFVSFLATVWIVSDRSEPRGPQAGGAGGAAELTEALSWLWAAGAVLFLGVGGGGYLRARRKILEGSQARAGDQAALEALGGTVPRDRSSQLLLLVGHPTQHIVLIEPLEQGAQFSIPAVHGVQLPLHAVDLPPQFHRVLPRQIRAGFWTSYQN